MSGRRSEIQIIDSAFSDSDTVAFASKHIPEYAESRITLLPSLITNIPPSREALNVHEFCLAQVRIKVGNFRRRTGKSPERFYNFSSR